MKEQHKEMLKVEKPEGYFDARVSGFNCTIPTLWIANRFRSTASSAFVLSNQDMGKFNGLTLAMEFINLS